MSESQSPPGANTSRQSVPIPDQQIREARVALSETDLEVVGVADLVSVWREAGIQEFEILACDGNNAVMHLSLGCPLNEDELSSLEYVKQWELVSDNGETRQYLLKCNAPTFPPILADQTKGLIDSWVPEASEGGLTIALIGSQNAIADLIEKFEAIGMTPDLRKLSTYTGRNRPLDVLTARQRDVLKTAYEMGYYDVPRQVSSKAVADEMNLEASTVSEHLQRAERNLLESHLPGERRK